MTWASTPQSLLQDNYVKGKTDSPFEGDEESYDAMVETFYPSYFSAAQKFLDFDGDGQMDSIYHPAGIAVPAAIIRNEYSSFQKPAILPLSIRLFLRLNGSRFRQTLKVLC